MSPWNINLTDDNTSIPCDAGGTPLPGIVWPSTTATLYKGADVDASALFTFVPVNCSIVVNGNTATLTGISATENSARVRITEAVSGLQATWSISKVKGGTGQDALIYSVVPSVSVIRVSASGVIDPPSVACAQTKQVGSGTAQATSEGVIQYRTNGNQTWTNYTGAVQIAGPSWTWMEFRLLVNDVERDRECVPVVSDGTNGTNGTDGANGTNGTNGADGKFLRRVYRSSVSQPSTPEGTTPSGWSFAPIPAADSSQRVWMSEALFTASLQLDGTWSVPIQFTGDNGEDGDGKPGPALIYMGDYNASTTYVGSDTIIHMVKEGVYYYAVTTAGVFGNVTPSAAVAAGDGTTGTKWKKFQGQFRSVATDLLLAEMANIAGWMYHIRYYYPLIFRITVHL